MSLNQTVYLILTIFVIALVAMLVAGAIWSIFHPKWLKPIFHDKFGWHEPDSTASFKGCSICSHCRFCGKEIMQDSQGNWF